MQLNKPYPQWAFNYGDKVEKKEGSYWSGYVVGFYSADATPEGYAVESEYHKGAIQIYPARALSRVEPSKKDQTVMKAKP